jgi:hypothetical protein
MTPDDKEFIIHFVLFWVMILAIVIQCIFDWPTDRQLTYFTLSWFAILCGTSLYRAHLEFKD